MYYCFDDWVLIYPGGNQLNVTLILLLYSLSIAPELNRQIFATDLKCRRNDNKNKIMIVRHVRLFEKSYLNWNAQHSWLRFRCAYCKRSPRLTFAAVVVASAAHTTNISVRSHQTGEKRKLGKGMNNNNNTAATPAPATAMEKRHTHTERLWNVVQCGRSGCYTVKETPIASLYSRYMYIYILKSYFKSYSTCYLTFRMWH